VLVARLDVILFRSLGSAIVILIITTKSILSRHHLGNITALSLESRDSEIVAPSKVHRCDESFFTG
jgi:hypothetical protein